MRRIGLPQLPKCAVKDGHHGGGALEGQLPARWPRLGGKDTPHCIHHQFTMASVGYPCIMPLYALPRQFDDYYLTDVIDTTEN